MIEFENYREPEYSINEQEGVIIGTTDAMLDLFRYLNHLADLPTTVLLRGETGTGKELCAKALHFNRKNQREGSNFVAVNCAGIPSELLESELFGYVKGAFTGADKDTQGKFQYAQDGTILLDEIGDMSPQLQAKILRVLQERKFTRIGSNETEETNVRIVAATNRNLEDEVKKRKFREDLFYRLNVVPIVVPALCERKEDIPFIAEYFVRKYNGIYGTQLEGLSENAKEKLKWAEWKGNVRELENTIERVFVLKKSGRIEADDLYLDSDMPRRILVQGVNVVEQEVEVQEPVEESKSLWYEQGVLPIAPRFIAKLESSKTYQALINITKRRKCYAVKLGRGNQRGSPLFCLTPANAHLFFRDTNTEDYRELETKMQDNEFNRIVEQPFAFFGIADLVGNPYTLSTAAAIKRVAEKIGIYKVPIGRNSFCFAVTLLNAPNFVANGPVREYKTNKLQEEINQKYEDFKNWQPS